MIVTGFCLFVAISQYSVSTMLIEFVNLYVKDLLLTVYIAALTFQMHFTVNCLTVKCLNQFCDCFRLIARVSIF